MGCSFERDIIPMAHAEGEPYLSLRSPGYLYYPIRSGMAFAPWNVLVSGKFRTDQEE
jgi:hypothetical protein